MNFTPLSKEEELVSSENSASIFNTLSDLPSQLRDGPAVLGEAMRLAGTLSQETLEAHRHKHLAYILNEQAQLNNGNNTTLNSNLNKVSDYRLYKVSVMKYDVICFSCPIYSHRLPSLDTVIMCFRQIRRCVGPFFLCFFFLLKNKSFFLTLCMCRW